MLPINQSIAGAGAQVVLHPDRVVILDDAKPLQIQSIALTPLNARDAASLAYMMRRAATHLDELAKHFQAQAARAGVRNG